MTVRRELSPRPHEFTLTRRTARTPTRTSEAHGSEGTEDEDDFRCYVRPWRCPCRWRHMRAASNGRASRSASSSRRATTPSCRFGARLPDVSGVQTVARSGPLPAGGAVGGHDRRATTVALRLQATDQRRASMLGIILDQPYGAGRRLSGRQRLLSPLDRRALGSMWPVTAVLKYRFPTNFSVYGGLRYASRGGGAHPCRTAGPRPAFVYGARTGDRRRGRLGYLAGVAYESPEIALRVALTYNSAIDHDLDTSETDPLLAAVRRQHQRKIRADAAIGDARLPDRHRRRHAAVRIGALGRLDRVRDLAGRLPDSHRGPPRQLRRRHDHLHARHRPAPHRHSSVRRDQPRLRAREQRLRVATWGRPTATSASGSAAPTAWQCRSRPASAISGSATPDIGARQIREPVQGQHRRRASGSRSATTSDPAGRRRPWTSPPCPGRRVWPAAVCSEGGCDELRDRAGTGMGQSAAACCCSACRVWARPMFRTCCGSRAAGFTTRSITASARGTWASISSTTSSVSPCASRSCATCCMSDSIYIASNITFDNLAPLSTYLGKPGDPAQGGLPFDEYVAPAGAASRGRDRGDA